jgi:hypothetical protein
MFHPHHRDNTPSMRKMKHSSTTPARGMTQRSMFYHRHIAHSMRKMKHSSTTHLRVEQHSAAYL